jgi:hypothetical protein
LTDDSSSIFTPLMLCSVGIGQLSVDMAQPDLAEKGQIRKNFQVVGAIPLSITKLWIVDE